MATYVTVPLSAWMTTTDYSTDTMVPSAGTLQYTVSSSIYVSSSVIPSAGYYSFQVKRTDSEQGSVTLQAVPAAGFRFVKWVALRYTGSGWVAAKSGLALTNASITLFWSTLNSYFTYSSYQGTYVQARMVAVVEPASYKIKVTIPVGVESVTVKVGGGDPQTFTAAAEVDITNGYGYVIYATPSKGYKVNYSESTPLSGNIAGEDLDSGIVATAALCTVTFSTEDGTVVSPSTKTVQRDFPYGELPVPQYIVEKRFLGWYTQQKGGTQITAEDIVTLEEDHALHAHWEPRPLRMVKFRLGEGIASVSFWFEGFSIRWQTFEGGEAAGYEGMLVKLYATPLPGYTYAHDSEATAIEFIMPPEGYTYNPVATVGTRELELVIGSAISSIKYKVGSLSWQTITATKRVSANVGTAWQAYPITKTGYEAKDTLDNPATGTITADGARYEPEVEPVRVMLAFDPQGGVFSSISDALSAVDFDATLGTLPVVRKRGYTFDGWYTSPNGQGTKLTASTASSFATSTTVYAHWI